MQTAGRWAATSASTTTAGIIAAARRAGAHADLEALPDGYPTQLGRSSDADRSV